MKYKFSLMYFHEGINYRAHENDFTPHCYSTSGAIHCGVPTRLSKTMDFCSSCCLNFENAKSQSFKCEGR